MQYLPDNTSNVVLVVKCRALANCDGSHCTYLNDGHMLSGPPFGELSNQFAFGNGPLQHRRYIE